MGEWEREQERKKEREEQERRARERDERRMEDTPMSTVTHKLMALEIGTTAI